MKGTTCTVFHKDTHICIWAFSQMCSGKSCKYTLAPGQSISTIRSPKYTVQTFFFWAHYEASDVKK